MKKYITLFLMLLSSYTLIGQESVDYFLKARALSEDGKAEQAIVLLSNVIDKKDNRFYLERAEAYILIGDYSDAIGDYNEANRITPSSGEYGLSRIYALKGDITTSLYHLALHLKSSFKNDEKKVLLDPAFGTIENKSEWRQFWKSEWYSFTERSISEIEYYISVGKIDESKAILIELKKSYQNENEILYSEALISYSSRKYTDAIKILSNLIASNPLNEKYLRLLALTQAAAANPVAASDTYSRLLVSGVTDAQLFLLRADCYRRTGENVRALADVGKFLKLYPSDKKALSLAGKIESASGDNLKALTYFSENLKIHPNDPECYIDRASSYFVSRSWDGAIRDYSMSLDLDPGNSESWLNKGIALIHTGRIPDGCHDLRIAFSLGSKRASENISRYCIK